MEPAGREDKMESAVVAGAGAEAGADWAVIVFEVLEVVGLGLVFVHDFAIGSRRTSASRGSSRGKIAPMESAGGSCVGMSALPPNYFLIH